jgi:hypothetical protein
MMGIILPTTCWYPGGVLLSGSMQMAMAMPSLEHVASSLKTWQLPGQSSINKTLSSSQKKQLLNLFQSDGQQFKVLFPYVQVFKDISHRIGLAMPHNC